MPRTVLPVVPAPPASPVVDTAGLQEEVRRLARQHDAVILAHNYQAPEMQDVADFVGDSLGLAVEATRTPCSVIVLCGVYFMAETAKILNPQRTVLIPDASAGCSLADSITLDQLLAWKAKHPDAVVVSYVNTTAAIKAESDYCVTSGNALAVIRAIPTERAILFLPHVPGLLDQANAGPPEHGDLGWGVPRACGHPAGGGAPAPAGLSRRRVADPS